MDVLLAGGIFVVAYALIASERFDRTLVALLGGLLVVVLGIIDQEEAFAGIDFNVIFLLAGMMILAGGLSKTGFFEYVAGLAIHRSRGEPFRLLVMLVLATALLSAVLDNVTTVVLLTPVTLSIARTLKVSPFPYLISQIFASNIGGTATLIGDPPNILIGSAAGLDFADFLVNLAPVVLVIMVVFLGILRLWFRRSLQDDEDRLDVMAALDPAAAITDRPLMIRALVVLGLTLVGFLFHSVIGVEAATIALLGATVLMIVGPLDPHESLRDIEWSTLFFFVGLFMLVEAVVHVGIVGTVANALADVVDGRLGVATIGILWVSAFGSAIVDNIPYTATAIPIVERDDRDRARRRAPLVGAGAGCVPRRQSHDRRRLGQHRRGQPRRPRRAPDHVRAVPALRLGRGGHVAHDLDRLPVAAVPVMRDDGEPISRGQLDRRAADRTGARNHALVRCPLRGSGARQRHPRDPRDRSATDDGRLADAGGFAECPIVDQSALTPAGRARMTGPSTRVRPTDRTTSVSDLAIATIGPHQAVPRRRSGRRPDRPARSPRRDLRVPRSQRGRQVNDDPNAARDDPTDGGARGAVRRAGAPWGHGRCGGALGHLVESATAYPELTVRENLDIARRLAGMSRRVRGRSSHRAPGTPAIRRIDERARCRWATSSGWRLLVRSCRRQSCSSSMSQRMGWIRPASSRSVSCCAASRPTRASRSSCPATSSGEVDRLATRVGIVHRGRLVEELDHDALEAHRDQRLEVEARDLELAEAALRTAGFSPRWRVVSDGPVVLELREPRALEAPDEVAVLLVAAGTPPTRLALARESLEDHFIRLTESDAEGIAVNGFVEAVRTEMLKARRSRIPWGVAVGFSLAPLVMGLFMVILKDPERARSLGLLGAKAQLTAGTADWPTYLDLLGQAVAVGGAILFAFLTAWVFGREFADKTVRGLLANPTSRGTIVIAKAIVVGTWGLVTTAWVLALGLVIGVLVDMPGWSSSDGVATVTAIALAAFLTIALQAWAACFASVGRGYIAPLAWTVAMVALSQILTVLGWGTWFPWAVPALLAGAGGTAVEPVTPAAVVLVLIVATAGLQATIAWWNGADQTG